ncbi:MAG: WXG100 family type VII secretion target [Mycobacteriales bacterium]
MTLPIPDPASVFAYPEDDPGQLRALASALSGAGSSLAITAVSLIGSDRSLSMAWHGTDSTAAQRELAQLASYAGRSEQAMNAAGAAIERYATAVEAARRRIDGLRRRYVEHVAAIHRLQAAPAPAGHGSHPLTPTMLGDNSATLHREAAELVRLEQGQNAPLSDVQAAAHAAASALRQTLSDVGIKPRGEVSPGAITALMATALPLWRAERRRAAAAITAAHTARMTRLGREAAGGLKPLTGRVDVSTAQHFNVIRKYAAWGSDPAFAAALVGDLGGAALGDLLGRDYPVSRLPDRTDPVSDELFRFYSRVLPAGLRGASGKAAAMDLASTLGDVKVRHGLGLAMAGGHWDPTALRILLPALSRRSYPDDLYLRQNGDDPMVGAMLALASDPEFASAYLGRPGVLGRLMANPWHADNGAALGTALATAATVSATSRPLTVAAVNAVATQVATVRVGVANGLAALLQTETMAISSTYYYAPEEHPFHRAIPPAGTFTFDRFALSQALYIAMHSPTGAAALKRAQRTLAMSALRGAASSDPRADPEDIRQSVANRAVLAQSTLVEIGEQAIIHQTNHRSKVIADTAHRHGLWVSLIPLAANKAVALVKVPVAGRVVGKVSALTVGKLKSAVYGHFYGDAAARYAAIQRALAAGQIRQAYRESDDFVAGLSQRVAGSVPPDVRSRNYEDALVQARDAASWRVHHAYLADVDVKSGGNWN